MRTSALFDAKKLKFFLKFMMCPHGQGGGVQFFVILCERPLTLLLLGLFSLYFLLYCLTQSCLRVHLSCLESVFVLKLQNTASRILYA